MGFSNVNEEESSVVLVPLEEGLEVAGPATEWRSGKAGEDQHQRPISLMRHPINLIGSFQNR